MCRATLCPNFELHYNMLITENYYYNTQQVAIYYYIVYQWCLNGGVHSEMHYIMKVNL
jgi:hypothetical protein